MKMIYRLLMIVIPAAALLLSGAIPVRQAFSQTETVTLSCYNGTTEEGNYIGDLSMTGSMDPAGDCNAEYDDCNGNCVACVMDTNQNQVCFDKNGRQTKGSAAYIVPNGKQSPQPY